MSAYDQVIYQPARNPLPKKAPKVGACSRFCGDERGSLLIFSLFLLVIMLMVSGMAVDLMRAESNRSRLQATLDRAVLAGASLEQTLDSEAVVRDYFDKAGLGAFVTSVNVTETPTSKQVNATAEMQVNSFFMNLLGVNTLSAPAGGQAEESLTDVEISLVVDVSGSMRWNSSASGNAKIDDLKEAAKEFVYLMQCDPDAVKPYDGNCVVEPNTVSINLVPYNEQVLLGETLIQQFNTTEEHTDSSCIDFMADDFNVIPVELDPLVADPVNGVPDPTPNLRRSATIDPWTTHYRHAHDYRRSCKPDTDRAVLVYENNYQDLEAAIDKLYAGGYTSIELGMKWGAALLAPEFRPALSNLINNYNLVDPAFAGRPFSYTRARTQKVVVLMTDGVNTTQHIVKDAFKSGMSPFWRYGTGGTPNADKDYLAIFRQDRADAGLDPYYHVGGGHFGAAPHGGSAAEQMTWQEFWDIYQWDVYTDYGTPTRGNLPNAVDKIENAEKNARLQMICDAVKAQGTLIFTIGFETTSASSAVMSNCASSPSHHYDVDGLNIAEAFNSIAREIHELRLTN